MKELLKHWALGIGMFATSLAFGIDDLKVHCAATVAAKFRANTGTKGDVRQRPAEVHGELPVRRSSPRGRHRPQRPQRRRP